MQLTQDSFTKLVKQHLLLAKQYPNLTAQEVKAALTVQAEQWLELVLNNPYALKPLLLAPALSTPNISYRVIKSCTTLSIINQYQPIAKTELKDLIFCLLVREIGAASLINSGQLTRQHLAQVAINQRKLVGQYARTSIVTPSQQQILSSLYRLNKRAEFNDNRLNPLENLYYYLIKVTDVLAPICKEIKPAQSINQLFQRLSQSEITSHSHFNNHLYDSLNNHFATVYKLPPETIAKGRLTCIEAERKTAIEDGLFTLILVNQKQAWLVAGKSAVANPITLLNIDKRYLTNKQSSPTKNTLFGTAPVLLKLTDAIRDYCEPNKTDFKGKKAIADLCSQDLSLLSNKKWIERLACVTDLPAKLCQYANEFIVDSELKISDSKHALAYLGIETAQHWLDRNYIHSIYQLPYCRHADWFKTINQSAYSVVNLLPSKETSNHEQIKLLIDISFLAIWHSSPKLGNKSFKGLNINTCVISTVFEIDRNQFIGNLTQYATDNPNVTTLSKILKAQSITALRSPLHQQLYALNQVAILMIVLANFNLQASDFEQIIELIQTLAHRVNFPIINKQDIVLSILEKSYSNIPIHYSS
ncbi:hypothetical protein C2869_01750 [Saccharobesus litoralis]|uniref:Uncharacterized protein n=1 Tax=Saccharobesus litoralis TaxID=2172099 RepID=A0A2S0VM19_9ALTE|nr:hypothetical protein [Saccharobesus litoralis]AWB65245.1 hypothetical protein C2869_01750 [Saccharobesus litoralis]